MKAWAQQIVYEATRRSIRYEYSTLQQKNNYNRNNENKIMKISRKSSLADHG